MYDPGTGDLFEFFIEWVWLLDLTVYEVDEGVPDLEEILKCWVVADGPFRLGGDG